MACSIFQQTKAISLLYKKKVLFFGCSNMRAIYKDLLWLLEDGSLIDSFHLQKKNEQSFAGDLNLTNNMTSNSRNYQEVREYKKSCYMRFQFITRIDCVAFKQFINELDFVPDVIVLNSCLWDLSRWGPNGVEQFKTDLEDTLSFLKRKLSKETRVVWLTTLPVSFECKTSLLTDSLHFLRRLLPFHILEANNYAATHLKKYNYDVLDLHYHLRFAVHLRSPDGVHWNPFGMRYIINLILTHLALTWDTVLPKRTNLSADFIRRTITPFPSNVDDSTEEKSRLNIVIDRMNRDLEQGKGGPIQKKVWNLKRMVQKFQGSYLIEIRNDTIAYRENNA